MNEPNKPLIYNDETLERLTQAAIANLPKSDIKYEVTINDDMVATIRPYRETFTFTVVVKDERQESRSGGVADRLRSEL